MQAADALCIRYHDISICLTPCIYEEPGSIQTAFRGLKHLSHAALHIHGHFWTAPIRLNLFQRVYKYSN